MGHFPPLFLHLCPFIELTDDWIQTTDLWYWKWLLYQLSHNHYPNYILFTWISWADKNTIWTQDFILYKIDFNKFRLDKTERSFVSWPNVGALNVIRVSVIKGKVVEQKGWVSLSHFSLPETLGINQSIMAFSLIWRSENGRSGMVNVFCQIIDDKTFVQQQQSAAKRLPQLSGLVCVFHPAASGSSPKHTIYAFFNLYCSICHLNWDVKRMRINKRGQDWPILKRNKSKQES